MFVVIRLMKIIAAKSLSASLMIIKIFNQIKKPSETLSTEKGISGIAKRT